MSIQLPLPTTASRPSFDQDASPELSSDTPSRPKTRLLLLAIVALAFALRLWSLDFQLPWQFHPDENHYVLKAVSMVQDGNLNPKYFRNPSLYTYLLYAQFKALNLAGITFDGLPWEI